ncbi:MAG: hypothetical protein ACRDZ5_02955 [Acidimicrobiales bacterium]
MGVLIVVACTAAGALVARDENHRQAFLAVDRYVAPDSTLVAADLESVSIVPSAGLDPIPVSDAPEVLGRRVGVGLAPGSLLSASDLTAALDLPVGDALVGASLSASQLPETLEVGDPVLVVLGGSPAPNALVQPEPMSSVATRPGGRTGESTAAGDVLAKGFVEQLSAPPSSAGSAGSATVTLAVPEGEAAAVADASAAGELSLAELPVALGQP